MEVSQKLEFLRCEAEPEASDRKRRDSHLAVVGHKGP